MWSFFSFLIFISTVSKDQNLHYQVSTLECRPSYFCYFLTKKTTQLALIFLSIFSLWILILTSIYVIVSNYTRIDFKECIDREFKLDDRRRGGIWKCKYRILLSQQLQSALSFVVLSEGHDVKLPRRAQGDFLLITQTFAAQGPKSKLTSRGYIVTATIFQSGLSKSFKTFQNDDDFCFIFDFDILFLVVSNIKFRRWSAKKNAARFDLDFFDSNMMQLLEKNQYPEN